MKKIITLTALLCSAFFYAQVGINNTDPQAVLEVRSTDSGILIPRIALTANNITTPVATPTTSELIYNTATVTGANGVTPGYYYWNGTIWVRLNAGTDANTNWSTTGNAGTTAGTNFIGTTDNIALRFRTNNNDAFQISSGNANNRGRLRAFNDGSVAQPTYSWDANPNMGMYRIGTDILGFSTAGTERMRIIDNGRTGINQNNPLAFLHITNPLTGNAPNGGPGIYSHMSTTTSNWFAIEAYNQNAVGGGGILGTGLTGVRGQTTDLVTGWAGYFNGDIVSRDNWVSRDIIALWGVSELSNTNTDDLTVWGTYSNPSDIRLKSNIEDLVNSLEIIKKLSPKKYEKNTDLIDRFSKYNNTKNIENNIASKLNNSTINLKNIKNKGSEKKPIIEMGLIAQDLEVVLPELVIEKKVNLKGLGETEIKTVNYIGLIPILIQGIQEQQEIIESQEARIAKLETLVNDLINKNQ